MNKKAKSFYFPLYIILIALVFIISTKLIFPSYAKAESLTVTRLTNSPNDTYREYPAIFGDKVVFESRFLLDGLNRSDIYLYDLSKNTETLIYSGVGYQRGLDIYGDKIVWIESFNGLSDIRIYDLSIDSDSDGIPNYLDSNRPEPDPANKIIGQGTYYPKIYGNRIIYYKRLADADPATGIYLYDIATGETKQIVPGAYPLGPEYAVWEDKVVYKDELPDGKMAIYMLDLSAGLTTMIVNGSVEQPDIRDGKIVWRDLRNSTMWSLYPEIYMYDLTTKEEQRITYNGSWYGANQNPKVFGNYLLYANAYNGWYVYNIRTSEETYIGNPSPDGWYADIYDNKIVYHAKEGDFWSPIASNIWMAALSGVQVQPPTVTISSVSDKPAPLVTGSAESSISAIKIIEYQIDGTDLDKWVPLSPAVITEGFLVISNYVKFAFNLPRLASGEHTLYMRAIDMNNNISAVTSYQFHVSPYWQELPFPDLYTGGPRSIAINSLNPNIIYVGIAREVFRHPEPGRKQIGRGGIYRSDDGGNTWAEKNNGFVPRWQFWRDVPDIGAVAIDPGSPDAIYAGATSNEGMWKSTDRGENWKAINEGLPRSWFGKYPVITTIAISYSSPNIIYIGSGSQSLPGIFKTTNGGGSWTNVGEKLIPKSVTPYEGLMVDSLAVDPFDPDIIYAAVEVSGNHKVFRSKNGGNDWIEIGTFATEKLAADRQNPLTLYAGTVDGKIYKTTNAGDSWVWRQVSDHPVTALVVSPTAPNKIFAGTGKKIDRAYGAGVYISNNSGDTWQASNEGFPVASDSVAKFDSTGIYPEVYAFDSSSTSPSSIFTVAGGTVYKLN